MGNALQAPWGGKTRTGKRRGKSACWTAGPASHRISKTGPFLSVEYIKILPFPALSKRKTNAPPKKKGAAWGRTRAALFCRVSADLAD